MFCDRQTRIATVPPLSSRDPETYEKFDDLILCHNLPHRRRFEPNGRDWCQPKARIRWSANWPQRLTFGNDTLTRERGRARGGKPIDDRRGKMFARPWPASDPPGHRPRDDLRVRWRC